MSEKHTPGPTGFYRVLRDTKHQERSWWEDGAQENGCYSCTCGQCGREFTGHKRRVVCKVCSTESAPDLAAEVERLRAELADDEETRNKMADILSRTAVALRGPEPERTKWGWSDLPERVAAALAAIEVMQKAASINGAEVERLRADLDAERRKVEAMEKDAVRWRYVHDEPESARHLIRLLLDGKGTPGDLDKMVDRIVASKCAALDATEQKRESEAQG